MCIAARASRLEVGELLARDRHPTLTWPTGGPPRPSPWDTRCCTATACPERHAPRGVMLREARRGRGVAHGRDGEAHRRLVSGRARARRLRDGPVWPHVCKGGRRAGVSTARRPTGSEEPTGEEPTGADTAAPTTAGDSSGGDGSATSGETDGDGCSCAVRHSPRAGPAIHRVVRLVSTYSSICALDSLEQPIERVLVQPVESVGELVDEVHVRRESLRPHANSEVRLQRVRGEHHEADAE